MSEFSPNQIVLEDHLCGGESGSFVLRRGYCLRLTDLEGGANVAALFYNAQEKLERYNMADTLKAQHIFYLTQGYVCYSDMGRILVSLTADTCGWHDTVCGVSNAALVREKYGEGRYQELRNDFYRNGHDRFLIELGKWGLGKRDLVANVNFFSKVAPDADGKLHFHADFSPPGAYVDLRAEVDERMERWMAERTLQEVLDQFDRAHAAAAAVYDMADIFADPHYRERGVIAEVDGFPMQNLVARLSATPGRIRWPGRALDADGEQIRAELAPPADE